MPTPGAWIELNLGWVIAFVFGALGLAFAAAFAGIGWLMLRQIHRACPKCRRAMQRTVTVLEPESTTTLGLKERRFTCDRCGEVIVETYRYSESTSDSPPFDGMGGSGFGGGMSD